MRVEAHKRSRVGVREGQTNLDDRERERKRWRDKRGGSPRL